MQPADFSSYNYQYHQQPQHHQQNPNPNPNPNPNSIDHLPPPLQTYASAPPFSSDYSNFPSGYSPYQPDPSPPQSYPPPNPNFQSFNQPPPPLETHVPYLPPTQTQVPIPPYYPPYDHQPQPPNYTNPVIPQSQNPNLTTFNPNSGSYPGYEPPYDGGLKLDHQRGGFSDLGSENSSRYGGQGGGFVRSQSDLGSDYYGKRLESGGVRFRDEGVGVGDGVYAYDGGKVDPYGSRGTSGKSSNWSSTASFDDYGRAIGSNNSSGGKSGVSSPKVVRAVPKVEAQQDTKNGVQKFRVKLLAESGGQSSMDVLCQIGLDGIRMLDPNTSRTLRIYPLETVTRSDKTDSSTFAFWSKSSVDIEPRRIRLQSNSYTTNTILDTVTAAIIQFKEMGGKDTRSNLSDSGKLSEQSTERKKGLGDWMNLIKPGNEEKDHWVPDEAVKKCTACGTDFGAFIRRHHCRNCGDIFCDKCTHGRIALTADENAQQVRVCDRCLAEVTQRLSNAKESANKPSGLHSHEDFARKLQEEMDRNRKASSGSKSSEGSGKRMREVACPTCTVHLQVQVPASGSETIECGVCQHPFLVSAH